MLEALLLLFSSTAEARPARCVAEAVLSIPDSGLPDHLGALERTLVSLIPPAHPSMTDTPAHVRGRSWGLCVTPKREGLYVHQATTPGPGKTTKPLEPGEPPRHLGHGHFVTLGEEPIDGKTVSRIAESWSFESPGDAVRLAVRIDLRQFQTEDEGPSLLKSLGIDDDLASQVPFLESFVTDTKESRRLTRGLRELNLELAFLPEESLLRAQVRVARGSLMARGLRRLRRYARRHPMPELPGESVAWIAAAPKVRRAIAKSGVFEQLENRRWTQGELAHLEEGKRAQARLIRGGRAFTFWRGDDGRAGGRFWVTSSNPEAWFSHHQLRNRLVQTRGALQDQLASEAKLAAPSSALTLTPDDWKSTLGRLWQVDSDLITLDDGPSGYRIHLAAAYAPVAVSVQTKKSLVEAQLGTSPAPPGVQQHAPPDDATFLYVHLEPSLVAEPSIGPATLALGSDFAEGHLLALATTWEGLSFFRFAELSAEASPRRMDIALRFEGRPQDGPVPEELP